MIRQLGTAILVVAMGSAALACGESEVSLNSGEIGTIVKGGTFIVNPSPGVVKAGRDHLIPVRAEFPAGSNVRGVLVVISDAETRLSLRAKYRCIGSSTQTKTFFLPASSMREVKIYALDSIGETIAQGRQPDAVLKGAELLNKLNIQP